MDLSQWRKLNEHFKISYTKKKFYKKYLYRLNYLVPGAYVLRIARNPEQIYQFLIRSSKYQHTGLESSLVKKLSTFGNLISSNQISRMRVEGSNLAIFAESLQELYDIAVGPLHEYANSITELVTVKNAEELDLLNDNYVIAREPTDYLYRVVLRQGFRHDISARHNLAKYLQGVGQEVKITKKLLSSLSSSNKYLQGGYFYVRDPDIITMIMLITPYIVLSVEPLVVKPNQ